MLNNPLLTEGFPIPNTDHIFWTTSCELLVTIERTTHRISAVTHTGDLIRAVF